MNVDDESNERIRRLVCELEELLEVHVMCLVISDVTLTKIGVICPREERPLVLQVLDKMPWGELDQVMAQDDAEAG